MRQLGATIREPGYIEAEFRVSMWLVAVCPSVMCTCLLHMQKLPNPVVNAEDIPVGAERKNRYSNVLPCEDVCS